MSSSSSSGALKAKLNTPYGVFVAPNDEVYIADSSNHRIRKVLRDGNIVLIAGNGSYGYSGDDGLATNAELYSPSAVFVSSNDEVYISDYNNNRIRKILRNGNIITIAGNGTAGYSGDDGPALNAQLNHPFGIYVTSNDEVYIADQNNHKVRKILSNGNIVTVAGNGSGGYSGDDGPATSAQLCCPCAVFVSSNEEVYISDFNNHRVRKVLRNGNIVTIAGNGSCGTCGENGPATSAHLGGPCGIFVSPNEEVYVCDSDNHKIRKILQNGNIMTIAGNGAYGYSGDGGPATEAKLCLPFSVYVDSNNEVFIADSCNHRIRRILPDGNIVTVAGNGHPGYCGDIEIDIKLNPHLGSSNISSNSDSEFPRLKVYTRDQLFDLNIHGFIPLLEKVSPQFCNNILKNRKLLTAMNSLHQEIIQKLINYLIYNNDELEFVNYDKLDVLFILGLFKNGEFIDLKRKAMHEFFSDIVIEEEIQVEPKTISSLLNEKKTSDVTIKIGQDKLVYCHKTVLSSSSKFMEALFETEPGCEDGILKLEESEDNLKLLEIIINCCYRIQLDNIDQVNRASLLDMAMKYEIEYLINYCKRQ